MFPWINNFLFTENNFLPPLIKQGSYSSPHYIFRSVYGLNTCKIKIHRRSVVKVLIIKLLGDSPNYMSPILVPSSAKSIVTQILVIAKLNGKKDFILRVFVCDIIRASPELPVQN